MNLKEYRSICVDEVIEKGYEQSGYESILSYTDWKSHICKSHTESRSGRIDEVEIRLNGGGVNVQRLRRFVEAMESAGVESVDVDRTYNYNDVTGNVVLYANHTYDIPKSYDVYLNEYREYVHQINSRNISTYKRIDGEAREKKMYLGLREKYGKEFGHI